MYVSPVQMMPACDHAGTPSIEFEGFLHFTSSTALGSASLMSLRIRASIGERRNLRTDQLRGRASAFSFLQAALVADFLAAVSAAPSKRFKVVGLGETARFIDGQITGGALVFDGRLPSIALPCGPIRRRS